MGMKTEIYRSALRDFDSMKTASDAKRRELKNRIFAENPRLFEIEKEINTSGADAALKTLTAGTPEKRAEIKRRLEERMAALTEEKEGIYRELGITEEYFDSV